MTRATPFISGSRTQSQHCSMQHLTPAVALFEHSSLPALPDHQARFYSFTTWAGSSYTLNTDVYLSVSATVNAFLLAGLFAWVVNSSRSLALADKAYFDREDIRHPASSDIVEHHQQFFHDEDQEADLADGLQQTEDYRRHTSPSSARHQRHQPREHGVSARPDSVDQILGYISRSKQEAEYVSENEAAASAPYQPQNAGYANYAQYLASVYGYRTGEPSSGAYQRRYGSADEDQKDESLESFAEHDQPTLDSATHIFQSPWDY